MPLWPLWWLWHPSEVWCALCARDEYHQRKGDQDKDQSIRLIVSIWSFKIHKSRRRTKTTTDLVQSRFMLFSGSGSCSWPSSLVSPLSSGLNDHNFENLCNFGEKTIEQCCSGLFRCVCPLCGSGAPTTWGQSSTSLTSSSPTGWIFLAPSYAIAISKGWK